MIIDLERFVREERPYWDELEAFLKRLDADAATRLSVAEIRRFHYLFERTAADLAKISTFSFEPETRQYLDALVARAYGEIHDTREGRHRFALRRWLLRTFPQTFRRHIAAFWVACAMTVAGAVFGGVAIAIDADAKDVIMPFPHLRQHPSERVAQEEGDLGGRVRGKASFSSQLMTHNIRVSILNLGMGMTWGVGTILLLFYNGVLLGAVSADYLLAGEARFLFGWLLPHGAVEIPAFLIAGQAGLLIGAALIGRGRRLPVGLRLKEVSGDVVTLIFGTALLLVWAGIIEAFLSQYHEPVIRYEWKILLGVAELVVLSVFLGRAGREKKAETGGAP